MGPLRFFLGWVLQLKIVEESGSSWGQFVVFTFGERRIVDDDMAEGRENVLYVCMCVCVLFYIPILFLQILLHDYVFISEIHPTIDSFTYIYLYLSRCSSSHLNRSQLSKRENDYPASAPILYIPGQCIGQEYRADGSHCKEYSKIANKCGW